MVIPSSATRVALVDVDIAKMYDDFDRGTHGGHYGTFMASSLLKAVTKAEAGKVGKVRFLGRRRSFLEFHPKTAATITVKAPCGDTASIRIASIRRAIGKLAAEDCA